jgi:primase-polymerase (primpol)-like protein
MPRQRELDELRARLFPPPVSPSRPPGPRAVLQSDQDLLKRVFAAKNGAQVERLFNGDTTGYGSHSEADLALVAHLAFWTDADPDRIDRLFRSSGLMREKWERADYRVRTIAKALA